MDNPLLKPIEEIVRVGGGAKFTAARILKLLEQWPTWERPIEAPAKCWLWHEMTSLHGVYGEDYKVSLNLPLAEAIMHMHGTIEKRGRLTVLPWET